MPDAGGVAYGVSLAQNHPHNLKFVSLVAVSAIEAEYAAVRAALAEFPGDIPLTVVCFSSQCHTHMSVSMSHWSQAGWVTGGGEPVPGSVSLQAVEGLLSERTQPVQWKALGTRTAPGHHKEMMQVLHVGLRLVRPTQRTDPPPPSGH